MASVLPIKKAKAPIWAHAKSYWKATRTPLMHNAVKAAKAAKATRRSSTKLGLIGENGCRGARFHKSRIELVFNALNR